MVRCLAIDLGAGSGRAIAARYDGATLHLTETARFDTPLLINETGTHHWDIDAIESHIRAGILDVGPVESVGIDSWGVDYVLVDGAGRRVGLPVSYRDNRTQGLMASVFERMSQAEIYRRTGIQFQPFNTLYQLAATARLTPSWLADARHFLMVPDYLNFRLCGTLANEYTNASTTQLLNLASRDWDGDLLAVAGVDPSLMQRIVEPGTILGETEVGNGLAHVVAVASHDTASAVVAAPLDGPDQAYISSGTWSLMGLESPVPFAGTAALGFNVTNEGGYGRRFRVLKNIMGLWLLQRIRAEMPEPRPSHADLVTAAEQATPWRSVINPDDPRFLNPPSMIAALQDYCAQTRQPVPVDRPHLVRCILDSLALSYRRAKEDLEQLTGRSLSSIRIIGGGSRNRLLNQLTADACQIPVKAGPVETSALGNVCVQLITLGALSDLDAARALVRRSFPIEHYRPNNPVPQEAWQHLRTPEHV